MGDSTIEGTIEDGVEPRLEVEILDRSGLPEASKQGEAPVCPVGGGVSGRLDVSLKGRALPLTPPPFRLTHC